MIHKDGRIEHERRFLVESDAWRDGGPLPSRSIEDLYLRGTRLRLRVMTELDGTRCPSYDGGALAVLGSVPAK
jgi:hypothetical protein